ncbi:hypothetical protein [Sphingomonas bacterium]|uniref:hypothetical protein n=1 Tax=Sphingomonas bacterium TaxID=1895847 RepID=UPI001576C4FC|nr:hypothetical protein [Sphingomonas bacterium]
MKAMLPLALLGGISACSSTPDDPGTIGADDQRQLNAAAAMLDSNSVDANAIGDHESSPHD